MGRFVGAALALLVGSSLCGAAVAKPAPRSPAHAEASPGVPMDPSVQKQVAAVQAFYEKTHDLTAHFEQRYHYASFNRTQQSAGQVVIRKPKKGAAGAAGSPAMRWDYQTPEAKSIVVTGGYVYMYQPESLQLTKSSLDLSTLSASITFLWGAGSLTDSFYISRAERKDLTPGVALELVSKKPDARFQRVFMLIDPKTAQVTQTIVVDPDGSENHMTFSDMKVDQGVPDSRFHLDVAPGTQVTDLTHGAPAGR